MATFDGNFRRIALNETKVYINNNYIIESQINQIFNGSVVVIKGRVKDPHQSTQYLPPLSPLPPVLDSQQIMSDSTQIMEDLTEGSKPMFETKDDSKVVLKNKSNKSYVGLNTDNENQTKILRPKRNLRSNSNQTESDCNQKKPKYDFKSKPEKNLNVNTGGNQMINKENKNNNISELSRVIGLPNMGNTCYINSIIQVLRITPGIKQFVCFLNKTIESNKSSERLKPSNRQLISGLHNIFVHFGEQEVNKTSDLSVIESKISQLIECDDIKNRFEFGQQQDCHEFLNWLINELNSYVGILFSNNINSSSSRRKTFESKQTFKGFEGVMLRKVVCNECHYCSLTHDSFADIQIPLCMSEDSTDIPEFKSFSEIIHKMDYLRDDNMFDCHNCLKKTNASVFHSIETLPKILTIFLKKPFEYNQITTRNVKPMKKVFRIPFDIEYSKEKKLIRYSLYGFVMHSGADINNGHYYAVIDSSLRTQRVRKDECSCARNVLADNGWIKINDHRVSRVSDKLLNKLLDDDSIAITPYLAFYHRIN